jgi:hypothetical protein
MLSAQIPADLYSDLAELAASSERTISAEARLAFREHIAAHREHVTAHRKESAA